MNPKDIVAKKKKSTHNILGHASPPIPSNLTLLLFHVHNPFGRFTKHQSILTFSKINRSQPPTHSPKLKVSSTPFPSIPSPFPPPKVSISFVPKTKGVMFFPSKLDFNPTPARISPAPVKCCYLDTFSSQRCLKKEEKNERTEKKYNARRENVLCKLKERISVKEIK